MNVYDDKKKDKMITFTDELEVQDMLLPFGSGYSLFLGRHDREHQSNQKEKYHSVKAGIYLASLRLIRKRERKEYVHVFAVVKVHTAITHSSTK